MLLAYYPAYLNAHPGGGLKNFLKDFFFVEGWPAGPPGSSGYFFFQCNLRLFGKLFIPFVYKLGNKLQSLADHPLKVAYADFMYLWLLYVPASWLFGAYTWKSFGPFAFQESHLFFYFGFFIFGAITGSSNIKKDYCLPARGL